MWCGVGFRSSLPFPVAIGSRSSAPSAGRDSNRTQLEGRCADLGRGVCRALRVGLARRRHLKIGSCYFSSGHADGAGVIAEGSVA